MVYLQRIFKSGTANNKNWFAKAAQRNLALGNLLTPV